MESQKQIVQALLKPEAYPEDPGKIDLVQTHISFVFLTQNFVFKMKKAVNFGFLDFTTLEKRRFFCEKELQLNRRLCGDMYIEVAPVNKSSAIKIKGEGETVEYVLKMKRMPQERIMTRLLDENKVDSKLIERIARVIADFHSKAETNDKINAFGSLATVVANWDENFEQTQKYQDRTIPGSDYKLILKEIDSFAEKNKKIFEERIAQCRIRDCHGDIHSGNIFIVDRIYIFDAIEFNERFRYSDVAADIAFLAMDLEFKGRTDLSNFFVEKYVEYSRDKELTKLLPFYKCYRAYVRGKVVSFRLEDSNITNEEKRVATGEAKAYFKLAAAYAKNL